MQTTIGSLLNTPPATTNEAAGSSQTNAANAFSAIFARELQQPGTVGNAATQYPVNTDDQPDQGELPLISVEESPVDAGLLAGIWAILDEVDSLQEVAGATGERLPEELTAELVDSAFELGRLADELSSALVQKPVYHAGNQDSAVVAGNGAVAGLAALPGWTTSAEPSGTSPGPIPNSQAVADALNRLRLLLDAPGQNTLSNPTTVPAPSAAAVMPDIPGAVPAAGLPLATSAPSELAGVSGASLDQLSAISQELTGTRAFSRDVSPSGREILQTLSSAPIAVTALPAGIPSPVDSLQLAIPVTSMPQVPHVMPEVQNVLSAMLADPVGLSPASDQSLKSLVADKVPNDIVDFDSLLDEGFKLQDMGTAVMREASALSSSALSNLDSLLRGSTSPENRLPGVEASTAQQSSAERTALAESRPAIAAAKLDVWLRTTEELPDHILAHVARMHAQSSRFNAAGVNDLVQRMTLSLHPEELGQVDVQMRTGEQMSLVFNAREGATRDLLEQNIARLRQMFEAQGITLGDISVGTGGGTDRQAHDKTSNTFLNQSADGGVEPDLANPSGRPLAPGSDRLIDIRA